MPNWTDNTLTITGTKEDLQNFYNHVMKIEDDKIMFDFNRIIPMPEGLVGTSADSSYHDFYEYNILNKTVTGEKEIDYDKLLKERSYRYKTREDIDTMKQIYKERLEKYDAFDWYDWSVKNWGTKWNACETTILENTDVLKIFFQTAWCAPIPVYNEMVKMFPTLTYGIEIVDEDHGGKGEFHIYHNGMWKSLGTVLTFTDEEGRTFTYDELKYIGDLDEVEEGDEDYNYQSPYGEKVESWYEWDYEFLPVQDLVDSE